MSPPPADRRAPRAAVALAATAAVALASAGVLAWLGTRPDPLAPARLAFDRGDYQAALDAAEARLRVQPGDPGAALLAARSAARLGLPRRAEIHFDRAGPLGPDDLQDRALGLVRLREPDRAAEVYRRLLAIRPDDALALKRLAAVLMDQKKFRAIPELADRLIAIPGEEVAGRTLAGIGHHVARRYDQAASSFERVLRIDPELKGMPLPAPLFWDHLGLDLMALGRNPEARAHLARAEATTGDAGLTELLGLAYYNDGLLDEAEACWRRALERDPARADAWLDLGRLALARRRPDEAVARLTRAAGLAPDSVEAYQNLGQAHRMLGHADEAGRCLRRAADLRRGAPQVGGMGAAAEAGP